MSCSSLRSLAPRIGASTCSRKDWRYAERPTRSGLVSAGSTDADRDTVDAIAFSIDSSDVTASSIALRNARIDACVASRQSVATTAARLRAAARDATRDGAAAGRTAAAPPPSATTNNAQNLIGDAAPAAE